MAEQLSDLRAALADRYRIERELGAGGMATVYLAHDLKHDRQVAVKVLHPHLAAVLGAERFLKEIKTTANLQHPHILPLFDSGDADGLLFYVMPFVDGESLRQRITREKQLPVADAVRITSEVASALDYAHRHGVIHRDIKPENILLHEGSALVADFGIALAPSAGGSRLTETGMSMGTPPYMSPEQALGERQLDARSDIYAVGAMLYEMLTGAPPFTGPSAQAIVAKVITEKPVPPSRLRKEIPAHVEDAVLTALQKNPADRFPTAQALQSALGHGGPTSIRRKPIPRGLVGAVGLVVLVAGGLLVSRRRAAVPSTHPARSIAVLPIENDGGDSTKEYLADGMTSELAGDLRQTAGLQVAGDLSTFRFKHSHLSPTQIAHDLGVGMLLTGKLASQGDRIRLQMQLNDTAGTLIWSNKYDREMKETFALQDEVTGAIAGEMRLVLSPASTAVARAGRTENAQAHDFYLHGLFFFAKRTCPDIRTGIDYFVQAIKADSLYASAYSGLSDAYSVQAIFGCVRPSDGFPQAEKAARRAIQLDSTLAQAHTSLGIVDMWYDWDGPAAQRELSRALVIDSQYAPAHLFRGWYFTYRGDTTQAIAEFQRASELDPLSVILTTRMGSGLYYARQYREAIGWFHKALELDSTAVMAHAELARAWLQLDRCDSALVEARFIPPNFTNIEGAIAGYALAVCGHRREAEQMLGDLKERAKHEFVFAIKVAQLYLGLGERDSAFAWLERGRNQHEPVALIFKMDPWYDSLRGDPRFARLVSKVGKQSGN